MKRKIIFFCIVIMALSLCIPCFAAEKGQHLVDEAQLLTSDERVELTELLDEISERQDFDVVVVTVDSLGEKSPMEYADDYYDYNGYRPDGCLLLVCMGSRDWWMSTTGYGITAITDYGIDYISDGFLSSLSDGDYAGAFRSYAKQVDRFVTEANKGKPYDVSHKAPKRRALKNILIGALVSLGIGLVISLITVFSIKSGYKPVRMRSEANDYLIRDSLNLRASHDRFVYSNVSRRKIEKESSGGGGSSTHTSSSGSSHGGGGGKF